MLVIDEFLFLFRFHADNFSDFGFGSVFVGAGEGENLFNVSTQAVLSLMRNVDVGSLDSTTAFVGLSDQDFQEYQIPRVPNVDQQRITDLGKFWSIRF